MNMESATINVLVYEVGGHDFDAHRCTPIERNDQPQWLSLANKGEW